MKQIRTIGLSLLLALVLCVALCACGGETQPAQTEAPATEAVETTQAPATAAPTTAAPTTEEPTTTEAPTTEAKGLIGTVCRYGDDEFTVSDAAEEGPSSNEKELDDSEKYVMVEFFSDGSGLNAWRQWASKVTLNGIPAEPTINMSMKDGKTYVKVYFIVPADTVLDDATLEIPAK